MFKELKYLKNNKIKWSIKFKNLKKWLWNNNKKLIKLNNGLKLLSIKIIDN